MNEPGMKDLRLRKNGAGAAMVQSDYYNRIAATYDRHYANQYAMRYRAGLYDGILRGLDLTGRRVLDAMCGGGPATGYFLRRGARVAGIDISEAQCRIYRERYPDCEVVCGSILQPHFPAASFDLVVTDSLHHLHPDTDAGVAALHRVLKPGGHWLLWEPCAGAVPDLARKLWYRLDRRYFVANEGSIDLAALAAAHHDRFALVRQEYGGNVAYLLVQESMLLRIRPAWIKYYAGPLLAVERCLNRIQPRVLSCWVLALLRKRGNAGTDE